MQACSSYCNLEVNNTFDNISKFARFPTTAYQSGQDIDLFEINTYWDFKTPRTMPGSQATIVPYVRLQGDPANYDPREFAGVLRVTSPCAGDVQAAPATTARKLRNSAGHNSGKYARRVFR